MAKETRETIRIPGWFAAAMFLGMAVFLLW